MAWLCDAVVLCCPPHQAVDVEELERQARQLRIGNVSTRRAKFAMQGCRAAFFAWQGEQGRVINIFIRISFPSFASVV